MKTEIDIIAHKYINWQTKSQQQTNICVLMKWYIFFLCFTFVVLADVKSHASENVTIGILAKRGEEITLKRWQPLAEYLDEQLPGYHFSISPLDFDTISNVVASHAIDFLFVNPGIYVELEVNFGVRPIATVRGLRGEHGVTLFSGLIITLANRTDIDTFQDLRGKSFMAVKENSLGGWLMAKRELESSGIDTKSDFKSFSYGGTHDEVVKQILLGTVDAGTVRSDTLEYMVKDNLLDSGQIKVIHGDKVHFNFGIGEKDFPFLHSTDIYPEWPMVKLTNTPDELADKVAIALLSMEEGNQATQLAGIKGWDIARNYQPVHDLYRDLRLGPYRKIDHMNLGDVWIKYWPTITSFVIVLAALCFFLLIFIRLRSKLLKANHHITHMAMHDPLTGLPNRRMFRALADNVLSQAQREGWKVYLLLIDLDEFKAVNDIYGHEYGDEVLQQVSNRIRFVLPEDECTETSSAPDMTGLQRKIIAEGGLRGGDIVARYGGDEFLSMLIHVEKAEDSNSIADRIVKSIGTPFDVFGDRISIGASIGISVYPDDGTSLEKLINKADKAMYEVKNNGKGASKKYEHSDSVTKRPLS